MKPIRPYAGLPVTPCGSKVMADCRNSHHRSPCFFGGLRYLHSNIFLLHNKNKFPSLPLERVVPTVVLSPYHMGAHVMCTALVVGMRCCWRGPRTASADCCVGQEMAPEALTTCFVLAYMRDQSFYFVN